MADSLQRDLLFLLAPGFEDGPGTSWFCPYCAKVEGLLAYAPELLGHIEVRRIAFARPRRELVELLGDRAQGCPVVVLAGAHAGHPLAQRSPQTGRAYVADSDRILSYLSESYDTPRPHF